MLPSRSETTEMPRGSMTFTSSTPGLGVWPGVVAAVSVGSAMFGSGPVLKSAPGVVHHLPSAVWMRARTLYVEAAFMPATKDETAPPPAGAGTGAVERPYFVVSPNSTTACEPAGSVAVNRATSGWLVGWTEAENSPGAASDMACPPDESGAIMPQPGVSPDSLTWGQS